MTPDGINILMNIAAYIGALVVFIVVTTWRLGKMFVTKQEFDKSVQEIENTIKSQSEEMKSYKTNYEVLKNNIANLENNLKTFLESRLMVFSKDIESIITEVKYLNGNVKQNNENQAKVFEKLIKQEEITKSIVDATKDNTDKIKSFDAGINNFYKEYGAGLEYAKKHAAA